MKVGCNFIGGIILQVGPFDQTRRRVRLSYGENDVDPDFWNAWLEQNRDAAIWTNGNLYPIETPGVPQ